MTLERIAQWIDIGLVPYQEAYELQERLAEQRKAQEIPDTILTAQHPLEVNFGMDTKNNQFSPEFLEEISRTTGNGYNLEQAIQILKERGILFSQTKRGGGATALAPGQLAYYPIVNHEEITGRTMGISDYKSKIYQVMFSTLRSLGVEGINFVQNGSLATREERRDVWINRNGKSLKMGSKALRLSGPIAYQGFILYIDKAGIKPFDLVNPCGYDHDKVSVTSVEEELGRKIDHSLVHQAVKNSIKKYFNYSKIEGVQYATA